MLATKHTVLHFQENRNVDIDEYQLRGGQHIDSPSLTKTWQLIGQFSGPVTGLFRPTRSVLPVHDRYHLPVTPFKGLVSDDELRRITDYDDIKCRASDAATQESEAGRLKLRNKEYLLIALVTMCLVYGIFVIITGVFI